MEVEDGVGGCGDVGRDVFLAFVLDVAASRLAIASAFAASTLLLGLSRDFFVAASSLPIKASSVTTLVSVLPEGSPPALDVGVTGRSFESIFLLLPPPANPVLTRALACK